MSANERADFVDMVAQAVIDKMEQRENVAFVVDQVVARVFQLQKEEGDALRVATGTCAEVKPSQTDVNSPTTTGNPGNDQ